MDAESGNLQSGARMVGDKSKEKCSICGSPGHTHLHCYGTPAQRTSNERLYYEALLKISTFYNGSPVKYPRAQDAANQMVDIADEALNSAEGLPDETTVGNERTLALEALALDVLATEQECANKQRFPNGCGECIYCQAAALMLNRPAVEPARELSPSEAASFAKTLARSPRRISYNSNAVQRTAPRRTREGWFRFSDGWHPVQPFLLEPGEDEAQAVQNCFPGQRVEFRGRKPPRG